jgi:hypothetical protein
MSKKFNKDLLWDCKLEYAYDNYLLCVTYKSKLSMDLYCELNGFFILTLGFLYGFQNDPMIDIMIFRDSNEIEFWNYCNLLIVSYF